MGEPRTGKIGSQETVLRVFARKERAPASIAIF
jgi:hypothetical protein